MTFDHTNQPSGNQPSREPGEVGIENELRKITPVGLSGALLDRFSDAMEEAAAEVREEQNKVVEARLDDELSSLESSLRRLVPHGMPENMISRLDEAMSRWHEKVPLNEKIVPLKSLNKTRKRSVRPGWGAVAAMVVTGAGAALLTSEKADPARAATQRLPVRTESNTAPVVFTPGDARASVVSANDRGILWTEDGRPVRCVEVELQNEVHFKNPLGEKLVFAEPKKREVILKPVKFD